MSAEESFDTLTQHGLSPCLVDFWASGTPPKHFDQLRQCLLYLALDLKDEPLPSVTVHAADGDIAINGPELEDLVALAKAMPSSV